MNRKSLIYSFVFIIIFLTSCIQNLDEADKVNISILHPYGTSSKRDIKMREIFKDFEKVNPNISLSLVSSSGFDRVSQRMNDLVVLGKIPDIIYLREDKDKILEEFMIDKNYIRPSILNDENYAIYDSLSIKGFWYNKKIFKNAGVKDLPKNFNEFILTCEKIKEWAKNEHWNKDILSLYKDGKDTILKYYILENHMEEFKNNKNIVKLLKNYYTDAELFLENLEFRNKMSSKEKVIREFNVGHTAIYIGEYWDKSLFSENLDIGFWSFPITDEYKYVFVDKNKYLLSNLSDEAQKKASDKFIKYILSDEVKNKISDLGLFPLNNNDVFINKNSFQGINNEFNKVEFIDD